MLRPEVEAAADELDVGSDIETEQTDEFRDIERPWDPEDIRVSTKHFSLRNMLDAIKEGTLDLAPDFQRLQVWTPVQRAQLIESILLQIPLPAFYFAEEVSGALQVVDGVQRLSTVNDFVVGGTDGKGGFKLDGLEYLADVKGKRFDSLPTIWKRRIYNTQIVAHVIAPSTPPLVMYDIFRRINTGGTPLNAQEIRHCISKPRSRAFLRELVALPEFDEATRGRLRDHKRMVDREVALRFVAFWSLGYQRYLEDEEIGGALNGFLLASVRAIDDPSVISDGELEGITDAFRIGLSNAVTVFGDHAFRKWPLDQDENHTRPFNRALFEVWTTELARIRDKRALESRANSIRDAARLAFTGDGRYVDSISSSTGAPKNVEIRFTTTHAIIEEAMR
jgi:Protein of unknown function DUF262